VVKQIINSYSGVMDPPFRINWPTQSGLQVFCDNFNFHLLQR
jgi:hypothetical protein